MPKLDDDLSLILDCIEVFKLCGTPGVKGFLYEVQFARDAETERLSLLADAVRTDPENYFGQW